MLDDPDITDLRRAELLALRDRVAAIKTTVKINGMVKKRRRMMAEEMLDNQNGRLEQSVVKQLKCIECGRIVWVPIEDADLEPICSQCLREEMREMDGFNPVRHMDCIEDTRLPRELEE